MVPLPQIVTADSRASHAPVPDERSTVSVCAFKGSHPGHDNEYLAYTGSACFFCPRCRKYHCSFCYSQVNEGKQVEHCPSCGEVKTVEDALQKLNWFPLVYSRKRTERHRDSSREKRQRTQPASASTSAPAPAPADDPLQHEDIEDFQEVLDFCQAPPPPESSSFDQLLAQVIAPLKEHDRKKDEEIAALKKELEETKKKLNVYVQLFKDFENKIKSL